ncbi:hypothetical protein K431DRAFT_286845 [Polychaeton citri CBS 116435]|uniref:Mitochondrial intermembrane space import and assembly protein 40 n=1 Tax=Polychaeton citri CBS 116435 TaxID=1314669 RepID=A0A9P4UM61_9PEZI|nr:hypothetical protein K431DRAFT_286845 [Polychaeton citri CBS 116435]
MFRPTLRSAVPSLGTVASSSLRTQPVRRFLSTAPHKKSRSWKSSVARWGAAGGLLYWYNTAVVFAEEPAYATHAPPETSQESETYQTLDAIAQQRRGSQTKAQIYDEQHASGSAPAPFPDSPGGLEEEASQQGAFNEETGEINWECPCLGGMAHGPCGEQFRAAFSCFVFSKEEPKGVDCIEHFKTMQNCFRDHPDVYGAELEDDEAPPSGAADDSTPQQGTAIPSTEASDEVAAKHERAVAAKEQVEKDHGSLAEADHMVPKAWHDTTEDNRQK